jgi:hypothetical protein
MTLLLVFIIDGGGMRYYLAQSSLHGDEACAYWGSMLRESADLIGAGAYETVRDRERLIETKNKL